MSIERELFFRHVAQTTNAPIGLEVARAEGIYMYAPDGKRYIDLISGVAVSNIGHCHPHVVEAVREQAGRHMHLMVYGEYVQSPQVRYAQALAKLLPAEMDNIYFVNSGSEAVEGALKLAKRHTRRGEIVSMHNAYHGSTLGALGLMGNEAFRYAFRPLSPGVTAIRFNHFDDLPAITNRTACVILDPLQSENGLEKPAEGYMQALRQRCNETGALLVFDEVQTAFGRTGSMFYWEQCGATPDIVVMAKALGGGMPLGAFAAKQEVMSAFTNNPPLGHITTFGGHPVCCAAGLAALEVLTGQWADGQRQRGPRPLWLDANEKGQCYVDALKNHPKVKAMRQSGLFVAVDLQDEETYNRLLQRMLENGLVTDSFLYKLNSFRIAPPLTITHGQIDESIGFLLKSLDET
ncbi:MAG: aspartate aminotransferase family protein [Bacteroidales bacterium]|nr:aspartate aminotransferase family protein [Bacteroidales bacterium]